MYLYIKIMKFYKEIIYYLLPRDDIGGISSLDTLINKKID